MNALLAPLGWWLVDFAWLATVLLAAAVVLRWVVRDPAGRVRLAWGAWLAIACAAVVTAWPAWPRLRVQDVVGRPARAIPSATQAIAPPLDLPATMVLIQEPGEPLVPTPAARAPASLPAPPLSLPKLAVVGWLSGVFSAIGWVLIGWWRMRRLMGRTQPAADWIAAELAGITGRGQRSPRVRTSERLETAVAVGALAPRIVLPHSTAVPANALLVRAALAHEWAHIQHGDLWLLALERSLLPLLALHPLFWWLRRGTRLDREMWADAAAAGSKPVEYAEALVAWAKGSRPHAGLAALSMTERPGNLTRRVNMILQAKHIPQSRADRLVGLTALAILAAISAALSLVTVRPTTAQDEPAPELAPSDAQAADAIRSYPLIGPARLTRTLPAPPAEGPAIMVELHLLSFDSQAAADAKIELPTTLQPGEQGTEGVGSAELDQREAQRLMESVLGTKGAVMLSEPKLVTLSGREANLVVGTT
ncbi:MAG TPA: M56 family metallopeptidase, partial [Pirellulaceae bacterium]|nr:M56 family metallopeptidase [Pirellulaceae bacterium]